MRTTRLAAWIFIVGIIVTLIMTLAQCVMPDPAPLNKLAANGQWKPITGYQEYQAFAEANQ